MDSSVKNMSLRQAALVSGIGLLLMTVIAPMANARLQIDGPTAADIRLAAAGFMLVVLLDILVAWGLYLFFEPVSRGLSLLAAWLRVAYSAILAAAVFFLIQAYQQADGARMPELVQTFIGGWEAGLFIFGIHLGVLGYLCYRSGAVPRIIGVLLWVAALGYMADGLGKVISADYRLTLVLYTFIGELVLMVWLLIRGGRDK